MKYYCYYLVDPRKSVDWPDLLPDAKGRIFYVGKGSGKRIDKHEKIALKINCKEYKINTHLYRKINHILQEGLKVIKIKFAHFEDEHLAHECEIWKIAKFGRENLCNKTDGGEGTSGHTFLGKGLERISGENNHNSKLTENQIYQIRQEYLSDEFDLIDLSEKYNINISSVSSILKKEDWKHLNDGLQDEINILMHKRQFNRREKTKAKMSEKKSGENNPFYKKKRIEHAKRMSGENHPKAKLTTEEVLDIRKKFKDGYSCDNLLKEYEHKIGKSGLEHIKYRTTWKHLPEEECYETNEV